MSNEKYAPDLKLPCNEYKVTTEICYLEETIKVCFVFYYYMYMQYAEVHTTMLIFQNTA